MLATTLKEATKIEHQETEKKVILRIKNIRNDADYANLLKCFYAYFNSVEGVINSYITPNVLPDYCDRRTSAYIKSDIETLGTTIDALPQVTPPMVSDALEAMAALYVLEGSIMGGPYIVQMLQKAGISKGFSFFNGYGAEAGQKWALFMASLNTLSKNEEDEQRAVKTASSTFINFGKAFE